MTSAQLALIISGLSLLIALVTLYRAELRGPRVKLRMLQAPSSWSPYAEWSNYTTDDEGNSFPNAKERCQLRLSGDFSMILENTGARAGVVFGLAFSIRDLPIGFSVIASDDGKPRTVEGKSSVAFVVAITLDAVVDNAAAACATYQKLPNDVVARAEYRASRPLGRIVRDHDEISVSKRLLIEPVETWERTWIKEP